MRIHAISRFLGRNDEYDRERHDYSSHVLASTTDYMAHTSMNKHQPDSLHGFSHMDSALDEALKESFPASDPIAISFPHAVVTALKGSTPVPGKNLSAKQPQSRKRQNP